MAKDAATEEQVEKPKGGKKKLIIIIVIAVIAVIGIGVGAILLLMKPPEDGAHVEEKHAEDEHPPIYEKLETFTVNLADRETYLQVEIHLQVADQPVQEKIKQRMPEVRDGLIRLLSSRMPEDLATQPGKDVLADEVKRSVNTVLAIQEADKGVKKVLFNSFIIQ